MRTPRLPRNMSFAYRKRQFPSASSSFCHALMLASEGIRRSPLGESATLPTFGPSGRQERLNCWEKNLR